MAVKTVSPSIGKPYEKLTVQEAENYMSYEQDYALLDVRAEKEYSDGHLTGAINLPYGEIVSKAYGILKDPDQPLYVYGEDENMSCAAAQKLSNMGYTGVAEIGSYADWKTEQISSETESLMSSAID